MSSFILRILSSTVGVLCNKIRDKTAEKLEEGDVTDAKLREIVVRELNDVKTKLDALSRKDLLSSYDFLDQGIRLLLDCIDNSAQPKEEEQKRLRNSTERSQIDASLISSIQSSERSKEFDKIYKLEEVFKTLSIESPIKLKTAVKKFENANIEATRAFNNESLSIEDRIFASKIRVVSTILECMVCSEMAITLCLSFLEKLHSLSAIREIFNVYINGGPKSLFNKSDRIENVRSVMFINRLLYQFIMKFGNTYHMALDWPTIQLKNKQFNPILNWREISMRNSWDSEVQGPNELVLDYYFVKIEESNFGTIHHIHYNSSNDLIYCDLGRNLIKIMRKDADDEIIWEFPKSDVIKASFIDKNDDMYIIFLRKTSSNFHLVVLHPHFVDESEISLDLTYEGSKNFCLFVSAENIVVYDVGNECVFVYDLQGKLIKQFTVEQKGNPMRRVVVTNENEIILGDDDSLYIYSMEGCLKSKVNLNIRYFIDFFYHFGLKKFLILERIGLHHYLIHSCDRSGKLEALTVLKDIIIIKFLSSSSVPVVRCGSDLKSSPYLMWC